MPCFTDGLVILATRSFGFCRLFKAFQQWSPLVSSTPFSLRRQPRYRCCVHFLHVLLTFGGNDALFFYRLPSILLLTLPPSPFAILVTASKARRTPFFGFLACLLLLLFISRQRNTHLTYRGQDCLS